MKKLTKLLLTLALFVVGVGGAQAVKLDASFQTPAGNGSWVAGTNTYSWTAGYNNLMTIFQFPNGELVNYTSIHLTTADYTDSYRICFMNGSTAVKTIAFYSAGQKDINFADRDETKDLDMSTITHISFGGNSGSGSVTLTNVYLEGPDPVAPLYREVFALGSPITFEEAKASSEPYVLVSQGKVFCVSGSDITYNEVSEISNCAWTIKFEADADNADHYYMHIFDASNKEKGYVNASIWSHTWLSGVDKNGTKGERQDGALWTVEQLPNGKYNIRNVGDVEGSYGDDHTSQGYLAITTDGYWANHVTHFNTSGEWEFYTLEVTQLPTNDPLYYGWNELVFSNDSQVTKDEDNKLVVDNRGYAPYWAETAKWQFDNFDATDYRYLVFYAKRNITQYGNGDSETGGTLFIKDANGVSFRQDDMTKYNDIAYPDDHIGKVWMNKWNEQRATVLDLKWLANTDKFGDGSECKVLDITKIKEIGVGGTFTIGGVFFTNTLPNHSNGDYTRQYDEEDSFDKFGTICLPYSAVCCGAQLYEIVGKTFTHILLAEVEGVMEAGKPYLYKTLEAKQQYWGQIHNENKVYFLKAGYVQVDAPVENNGLIGTFSQINAPQGDNIWILKNNKLYDTAGSNVAIGANKAYIDVDKIVSVAGARVGISINFDADETTGIADVRSQKSDVRSIYNLQGQRVNRLQKGLNIVNGKKVLMK